MKPGVLHFTLSVLLTLTMQAGMTKINVSTHLNKVFTDQARAVLDAHPALVDTRKWTAPTAKAMTDEVARLLTHYQAATVAA